MKRFLAFFLIFLTFLTSCSRSPIVEDIQEKKEFYVETYTVGGKMESSYFFEKSGRLSSASSITLSADSAGEIASIFVKEGTKVRKGSRLISLKDTINSFDIRLAQAENAVNIQNTTSATTKLSLDKAVSDTQIAYEQAKKAYDLLISKNSLIYDTLVNNNKKTLETYNESYKTYLSSVETLMNNFLYEGDRILGMTSAFQYTVDGWKPYLGAKIGNIYSQATNEWNNTYASRGIIRAKKESGGNLSESTLGTDLEIINNAYLRMNKYIDTMIEMTQNNIIGGGLSQEMQNGWIALWNNAKSQLNTSETSYNTWKSQTLHFFKNYKNNEIATKLAIESLSRDLNPEELSLLSGSKDMWLTYENTRLDIKDKTRSAQLALEQAITLRDTAIKNRELMRDQLDANRVSVLLSRDQAERDYARLAIVAPFDGVVTKIIGNIGQKVTPGMPLIEIASNNPEIIIDLDNELASHMKNGDEVVIKTENNSYTGKIIAISRVAGKNLLYTTRISVPRGLSDLGRAVNVIFPVKKESFHLKEGEIILLPLRSVKIVSEQEGEIALLQSGSTLLYKSVRLGKVLGEGVEILDTLNPTDEIIISDISNYDNRKHILTKKN